MLQKYRAKLIELVSDEILFRVGDPAADYFQVEAGSIKTSVVNPEGHEFILGIYERGESFGEAALIGKYPHHGNACAIEASKVWRMPGNFFFQMLKENFSSHVNIDQVLCQRLKYKSMVLTEVSSHAPEHRIHSLLQYFKAKHGVNQNSQTLTIPYTRQQLADMVGLRVETVIRTVKRMEKEGVLQLQGHKIIF
ncbi:MAG TPA: Crp/Fnr family transcriptional regulator [Cyclobacteriaceae bacterium]|nr:Crp/Fnr family transcriptional regulator [Cyclobacteriaceae bacterium]HMV10547.1 Crp/Fnr family transcriptional regulator [Cyclobacteriaceae bacterium]HMW99441.1 Crp/Fnr family transcriptional regulator [Cyclobacteriaceae bacterium]HMX48770.1 Crp/Fnr family transcriptional regulator [Cyclobacteriaceae bacterium]HMY94429.1 Crp/Fnr family transcriptional regulator [Cyclobacteriaceae bacterium]